MKSILLCACLLVTGIDYHAIANTRFGLNVMSINIMAKPAITIGEYSAPLRVDTVRHDYATPSYNPHFHNTILSSLDTAYLSNGMLRFDFNQLLSAIGDIISSIMKIFIHL